MSTAERAARLDMSEEEYERAYCGWRTVCRYGGALNWHICQGIVNRETAELLRQRHAELWQ